VEREGGVVVEIDGMGGGVVDNGGKRGWVSWVLGGGGESGNGGLW
jgi:hypothetical protein